MAKEYIEILFCFIKKKTQKIIKFHPLLIYKN